MTTPCSEAAQERGDDPAGTAAPAQRWLLVEDPGPWGPAALPGSHLGQHVLEALSARARDVGARVQLVRRHGRRPRTADPTRRWALADARPGRESLRWGRFVEPDDLLHVPLDGTADGHADPGPVYLVCAHGRHDPCCATRGRAVAFELARLRPDSVWETTHLGGCRFAANVVVLPHGWVHGQVDVDDVPALVAGAERGVPYADRLRGRSSLDAAAQAVEARLRREGARAVRVVEVWRRGEAADVVVEVDGARRAFTAVREVTGPPTRLTCKAARPGTPTTWVVEAGP